MKDKKGKMYSARQWLNPEDSCDTGMIASRVEASGYGGIDAGISIWDCSRKIELNFSVYSERDAKDGAAKLNMLIAHLIGFRSALGKAYTTVSKIDDTEEVYSSSIWQGFSEQMGDGDD